MQQSIRHTVTTLLSLFVSTTVCFAQLSPNTPNSYTISFLQTQDGLSQASNSFMLQDAKGYMWISSQDGINRYNGNEFFHFNNPKYYKNCMPFKQAYGLVADVLGDIWMGSARGLYRYSQRKNVFEKFEVFPSNNKPNNMVLAFAAVGDEVWVTNGINKFASINCKTYEVKTLFEISPTLKINRFNENLPVLDKTYVYG